MITDVIIETYKKRRYNRGVIDRHKLWEDWNKRRQDAKKLGQAFTEEPPKPPAVADSGKISRSR